MSQRINVYIFVNIEISLLFSPTYCTVNKNYSGGCGRSRNTTRFPVEFTVTKFQSLCGPSTSLAKRPTKFLNGTNLSRLFQTAPAANILRLLSGSEGSSERPRQLGTGVRKTLCFLRGLSSSSGFSDSIVDNSD